MFKDKEIILDPYIFLTSCKEVKLWIIYLYFIRKHRKSIKFSNKWWAIWGNSCFWSYVWLTWNDTCSKWIVISDYEFNSNYVEMKHKKHVIWVCTNYLQENAIAANNIIDKVTSESILTNNAIPCSYNFPILFNFILSYDLFQT